jgi:hypothetical protein
MSRICGCAARACTVTGWLCLPGDTGTLAATLATGVIAARIALRRYDAGARHRALCVRVAANTGAGGEIARGSASAG